MSVLPGLNSLDLVIGVGAKKPVYGSGFSFATNVARRLDRIVFLSFVCGLMHLVYEGNIGCSSSFLFFTFCFFRDDYHSTLSYFLPYIVLLMG